MQMFFVRSFSVGAALFLLAGAGCATTQAAAPSTTPDTAATAPADAPATDGAFVPERDWRKVVADVVRVRHLAEKRPLVAQFHDEAAFKARLKQEMSSLEEPGHARIVRAEWFAFGLVPPGGDAVALLGGAFDSQVAAFYDPKEHVLHLRRDGNLPMLEKMGGEAARAVVAHEIQHGLQDQHFGFPDLDSNGDDAVVAHHAVLEGEAMLVMLLTATEGQVAERDLVSRAKVMGQLPPEQLLQLTGMPDDLKAAPPAVREELLLPYTAGIGAVASAYELGGWSAVATLLTKPPASTEQLLHFDAYVAGERPLPVLPPLVPTGWNELSRGTMGEAGLRLVFGSCMPPAAAAALARGWGGDAYVVSTKDDRISLAWTLAFDDEERATMVTGFFRGDSDCWKAGTGPGGRIATPGAAVTRAGRIVTVVRGLDADEGKAHSRLLAQHPPIQKEPPQPPFAERTTESASLRASKIVGQQWTSPWLGLVATAPPGYQVAADDGLEQLMVTRPSGARGVGLLQRVAEPFGAASVQQNYDAFKASILQQMGADGRVTDGPVRSVDLGWGRSERRTFKVAIGQVTSHVEFFAVPYCDGSSWILVTTLVPGLEADPALSAFVASINRLGTPHVCAR